MGGVVGVLAALVVVLGRHGTASIAPAAASSPATATDASTGPIASPGGASQPLAGATTQGTEGTPSTPAAGRTPGAAGARTSSAATPGVPGVPAASPSGAAVSPQSPGPAVASPSAGATNDVSPPSVSVTCSGMPSTMKRGATFSMTYDVVSASTRQVGLGAALYDGSGADQADGTGDENAVSLSVGHTTTTRSVSVPASLSPGTYEVDGELWPPNQIGNGEPLTSASCGNVQVVK